MSEAEVAPGKNVDFSQTPPGKAEGPTSIRMKIADIIYVLDIQNKNRNIDKVLAKYGVDESAVDKIKSVLYEGQWNVFRN
jgi:hypothetical protein